jgi:hypothetical protein
MEARFTSSASYTSSRSHQGGSLHNTVLRPDSAPSRNRCKRTAEDSNEENMSFKKRREGRLPPPSTETSRRGILFGPRVLIRIHVPAVGHLSGQFHAAPRVFQLGVNLCVPTIPAVTKLRPRVDDNY